MRNVVIFWTLLNIVLVIDICNCQDDQIKDDVASEAAEHQNDFDIEGKIQEYIDSLAREKATIEEFLKENNEHRSLKEVDPEMYVSHPVNSYNLLKRMAVSWRLFNQKLGMVDTKDLGNEIHKKLQQELENVKEVCTNGP
eukprot:TRINITY_DN9351_c0_g1_i1.p1 TRINITY_DN9351_c0_g1~~TRINITY_DN9351_c0_g1_i1.p1  ORF type:complete len:140 (-),score=38.46 TRINITY_DN9351_c0_g1_i1:42-461(-)